MSRRLRGGIPRAYRSHKGADAAAYRAYVLAIVERLGFDAQKVPADCQVTLREAGRLAVELQASGSELEAARAILQVSKPNSKAATTARSAVRQLRRQLTPMRTQLVTLERRLEQLAASQRPRSFAEAVRRAGAAS